jgi:hypothetical protein
MWRNSVSYQTTIKSTVLALGIAAIANVTIGGVAPANAASITGFPAPPWTSTGSITPSLGVSPASVELSTGGTATDATNSSLQNFLSIAPDALDDLANLIQAFEGSALKLSVNAGDQLTLDFNSVLADADDYAFTVFNGVVTGLGTASGSLNQTFGSSGLFGIGIVDRGDTFGDSSLFLRNATFTTAATPVPTPALLPGLIGLGLSAMRKRKQQSA